MKRFLGAVGLIAVLSACGTSNVGQVSPSPQPASPSAVTSPSPSASPAASPSPSAAASPSPSPAAPDGFAASDFSGGSVAASQVAAVRIGHHDGYDRFVIEFTGGIPSYSVTRQPSAVFTRSPRGDQVTLAGSAGVLVVIHSVTNWIGYAGPTSFNSSGYPYLKQALQVENFEGYQQWALGVDGTPYLRVFTLGSPSRLVIDVTAA